MAFIQFPNPTPIFPVLPPLTWSVHKKPIMASRVSIGASGRECQLACAAYPRWAFILSYGGGNSWLREQTQNSVVYSPLAGYTELEQLTGLFLACLGSYGEFYYVDPDDNSRLSQAVGTGDGATTTFPLYYTWGNGPFTPSLTIPVGGIQTINAVYFNGTVQSAAGYSLDSTKTKVVFTVAPTTGVVITIDFQFFFRCRFLDDTLDLLQFSINRWDVKEVRFESVKP